jgi:hypothetical protein
MFSPPKVLGTTATSVGAALKAGEGGVARVIARPVGKLQRRHSLQAKWVSECSVKESRGERKRCLSGNLGAVAPALADATVPKATNPGYLHQITACRKPLRRVSRSSDIATTGQQEFTFSLCLRQHTSLLTPSIRGGNLGLATRSVIAPVGT